MALLDLLMRASQGEQLTPEEQAQVDVATGGGPPTALPDVAPAPPYGRFENLLEGFAPLASAEMPAPRTFAEGLVGGFSRGLGSAAERAAKRRQTFEVETRKRQAEIDEKNREETRKYRERIAGAAEKERGRQEKQTVVSETDVKANPALGRFIGKSVPIEWLKPERPQKPERERIVAIQTPQGPRYVREGDALGREPAKSGEAVLKPPSSAERQQIIEDNNVIRQTDTVAKSFRPEFVGPASDVLNPSFRANPDRAKFASALAQYTSAAIHQLYGGALTPSELARVRPQFPQMTDPPANFFAKLVDTQDQLRQKARERRATYEQTGLDLSGLPEVPEIPVGNPMERPPLSSFRRVRRGR